MTIMLITINVSLFLRFIVVTVNVLFPLLLLLLLLVTVVVAATMGSTAADSFVIFFFFVYFFGNIRPKKTFSYFTINPDAII